MNHIADEAGVSQPRISQVFDGKLSAYLAAHEVSLAALIAAFEQCPPSDTFDPLVVREGFLSLLKDEPAKMRLVLHSVSAGTGDPEIGQAARRALSSLTDLLADRFGATPEESRDFLARGLFITILVSTGLPSADASPALAAVVRVTSGVGDS